MNIFKAVIAGAFFFGAANLVAQETKKDDKNKIQEVVTMVADPLPQQPGPDGSIPADTGAPKPMPSAEILKRAVNFVKVENPKYTKTNGVTTGSKAEFIATFNYKPKELNPQADVQGTFTMHVSIDAKEGKYRYTISKITHNAKNAEYSGGDIYSEVPKCGSMKIPPDTWKRLRSEAFKNAGLVSTDIKEAMKRSSVASVEDEW